MKKNIISLLLLLITYQGFSCSWWDPEYEYYNLFAQTSIGSPMYEPFLLVYDSDYFYSEAYSNQKNENIEDWQKYFEISYDQAYYLVFKASREEVQKLSKGNSSADEKLKFANSKFKNKYKQALLYLAYAKFLEPYMAFKASSNGFSWVDLPENNVGDLDYEKVIDVLTKSWNYETDKDLKIRYGYQLVRFTHYYRKYDEAVDYFNQYVESLNYRPVMYYYALDQKGGAERGRGNYLQANYDFFQFFNHTKNRKTNAYTSMRVTRDLDFEKMLNQAKTDEEKFDLYMLLGYQKFNDPVNELSKIISISPDAVQAKVLMAREVNSLEREFLQVNYYCPYDSDTYKYMEGCFDNVKDKRIPVALDRKLKDRLDTSITVSEQQSQNTKEKDFWLLTTSYLYFLKKDYGKSSEFLSKVNSPDPIFKEEKKLFEMLLEISKQPVIDLEFEDRMMKKYRNFFEEKENNSIEKDGYNYHPHNSTRDFVMDILANRYFLQQDYAKSFLLQNQVTALESNPDLSLLNEILKFYEKKNKNEFEKFIVKKINNTFTLPDAQKGKVVFDFSSWTANMKGTIALSQGDFQTALNYFNKVDPKFSLRSGNLVYDDGYKLIFKEGIYNGFSNIPAKIFGYNKMECFECPEQQVVVTDFLEEFPFIKSKMNKKELTEALMQLNEEGKKTGEKAAKANYLTGNFFYNTTLIGYYREVLTFDINNSNGPKFRYNSSRNPYFSGFNELYLKEYSENFDYRNNFEIPVTYLESALAKASSAELKARILFALSKCEQGVFYESLYTDPDLVKIENVWDSKYEKEVRAVKTSKYRTYFKELKKYNTTDFYKEVESNCKYFNYYSSHY